LGSFRHSSACITAASAVTPPLNLDNHIAEEVPVRVRPLSSITARKPSLLPKSIQIFKADFYDPRA
jgi:hypothetical protein